MKQGGGKGGTGKNSSGRGSGARELNVRLKTARKRTHSSQLWLERQLNDPYVERAKREGFRSRAAFKLIEMDDKVHLLKPGARVVDLGAAPGGWSQIAAKRVRAAEGRGRVIAIDLLDMEPVTGVGYAFALNQLHFGTGQEDTRFLRLWAALSEVLRTL